MRPRNPGLTRVDRDDSRPAGRRRFRLDMAVERRAEPPPMSSPTSPSAWAETTWRTFALRMDAAPAATETRPAQPAVAKFKPPY